MIKKMKAFFGDIIFQEADRKQQRLIKIDPANKHKKITNLPDRGFAFDQAPGNAPQITDRLSVKIIRDPKVESLADFQHKRKNSNFTSNQAAKSQYQDYLLIFNKADGTDQRQSSNFGIN